MHQIKQYCNTDEFLFFFQIIFGDALSGPPHIKGPGDDRWSIIAAADDVALGCQARFGRKELIAWRCILHWIVEQTNVNHQSADKHLSHLD